MCQVFVYHCSSCEEIGEIERLQCDNYHHCRSYRVRHFCSPDGWKCEDCEDAEFENWLQQNLEEWVETEQAELALSLSQTALDEGAPDEAEGGDNDGGDNDSGDDDDDDKDVPQEDEGDAAAAEEAEDLSPEEDSEEALRAFFRGPYDYLYDISGERKS